MAEDRKALLRRKAAHSALQGTPQSEDVRNRIQDVLALSGGVLTSGASYDHLMRTIREYADETHQPLERVLRDSAQLEGIITGEGRTESHRRFQETFRTQGRRRALANAVMEQGGKSATLPPQELKDIRDAVLAGDINKLPSEVRARLRDLSEQIARAQRRARGRIKDVVLYSPGGESPRLAKFAGEYGQLLGSGGSSSQQIMENWKKNVDPEFLKKLSFVHWTTSPENLATGRGIPAMDGTLSAGIYFRGDPTGHGFVSNKFSNAPFGLVLEGDITWTGNRDVYSYGGEVGAAATDYVRDPILDEATFETQATRVERRMIDAIEAKRSAPRPGAEDYPFSFTPNINEALIKKPRVVGIVVDPATFDILSLRNLYAGTSANYNLTRAMVFAEEMGIPIYNVAGQPLPEIFQPESVNPAEIKRVAQNFPSAAELTGGKGYARTAGGKSLFQALSNLESHGSPEDLTPLPDIPSMQEMRAARRELEAPNHGGKKRAELRTEMRKRLWQESQLHSGSTPHVSHKTLGGHVTHLSKPLSTPEEFAEAWRFERLKKDFKESFFGRGVVDSYSLSAPENPLFSDPSLTEGLHPSSPAEEIFEALIKKPQKAMLLEMLTLMDQVGEEGRELLEEWQKLKAVQGEKVTSLEMQSKLKEIYDTLMEQAREMGRQDAYRSMAREAEAKTLSQEEVQGWKEEVEARAERRAARPSLDDLLQDEGIPREAFQDFSELPEHQGKPTRSVIEAYKIAGELPESAGVPEGRSPKAYPAQDPEARLSVVEGSSPEYKPQLSVEKARAALADPAQQDDFIHWLATQDPEARIPDKYADLTPTPVEARWEGELPEVKEEAGPSKKTAKPRQGTPRRSVDMFEVMAQLEEEVGHYLEGVASGEIETPPEQRKALLADEAVKAKWGPRIVKGLTVLGDVALAADLGYQLGKHGPSGIMDVGAHTVEGAALMAELPEMALKRTPGRELREEAGALTPMEHLAGAAGTVGRAVKGTMDPFHRHRDRQERVKKLEALQAEYESTGLDTMAARRQAAADIAAGGVAPAQPGVKFQSPEEVREEWIQEQKRAKQPPMTTDPREMARWAAKRALEK